MSFANLPPAVAAFLRAVQNRDGLGLLALFSDAAVLVDDGSEYRGEAIKEWLDRTSSHVHPVNLARRVQQTLLTVIVRDNETDRAAGPVEIEWLFAIEHGKISHLTIRRAKSVDLPRPVAAYVSATNSFDLEALMATFAEDALVNDQLCEYWGKAAIREWAARDIIGERVTMYVVKLVEHYGHAIVTANVDGNFDKRGLPDPLVLVFYFSAYRDRITQLIILRKYDS